MIVLDTHAWVWHASKYAKLSKLAQTHIEQISKLGVHPVSCWEVAWVFTINGSS